jgi:hypothetical protein
MSVKFYSEKHKYESVDPIDNINWVSATSLIHKFKEHFDAIKMSEVCSKGKNPKYKGKTPEEIRELWAQENKRAINLGSWYHDQREKDLLSCNTLTRNNNVLPIITPLMDGEVKLAPSQALIEGVYPEHMVYLKSIGVCGQADRVEVYDNQIHLFDYKTNKEIKKEGFKEYNGKVKKMRPPLSHLDDCNFNDYALQLSIYMYIMHKHNFHLDIGMMQINHILFEIEKHDEQGNPIVCVDALGDPVVSKIIPYDVPYLKNEVIAMFKHIQQTKL